MDVKHDRVCLIYSLIRDEIDINAGAVIFFTMKKLHYHQECKYSFGSLLTRILRNYEVEEEELDYRSVVDTRSKEVSSTKELDGAHGPVLTMPDYQA